MTNSKKNIIIIGPAHPLRGGLATFNERLALAFRQEGHQASIYSFSLQYPGFLFPGTSQFSDEPAPKDVSIHTVINSVNPLNWIKIGNKLRKLRPDLVIVRYWIPFMGPCLGTILRITRKNKHTRIVCIADNIIPHEKRPGDNMFTRYFVKPVDAFITMSQKVMTDLHAMGIKKPVAHVAHPLYDNFGEKISREEARKHIGADPQRDIMLFFGFIRNYKGLDILLDAMRILRDQYGSKLEASRGGMPLLLIAGEFYEDRKPFDEQVKALGIQDLLILHTHFIPNSDVKYYLCAADVLLQPYRKATQSGVTPLAYHFELPMIVTNVAGLPALVPDGKAGLVAEPDAASIAAKISEFFEKGPAFFLPHLLQEKKKYSWDKMVDSILDSVF